MSFEFIILQRTGATSKQDRSETLYNSLKERMRTVVYNARIWQWSESVYTQNISGNVHGPMTVIIQDGTIVKIDTFDAGIFDAGSFSDYDIVVDAKNNLLLPGLIGMQ